MIDELLSNLKGLDDKELIDAINNIKIKLHEISPFRGEPVDCVIWVKNEEVTANDYNPNSVAPPEMKLLEHSIIEDGYTQPIVTFQKDSGFEVVDGFHRSRVGKESPDVKKRVLGYVPVVKIRESQEDLNHRMASTIRHNRARGKHKVQAMSDIVIELKRRNWSDSKIAKNLGMDEDEVLRLCQITGMSELFADADFSKSWDIGFEDSLDDFDFEEVEDAEN
jgi:ParB-like chromosome segregation protein Spo0J